MVELDLIDDVNSSQPGKAQYIAHFAILARSLREALLNARHSNASAFALQN